MEPGRRAVGRMFGVSLDDCQQMAVGLSTIPEIAMVGRNDEQLRKHGVPYAVGAARRRASSSGSDAREQIGLLKLLVHRETRKLLGVHCIGDAAIELIRAGQSVMSFDGTIDHFQDAFADSDIPQSYKVAAFDALRNIDVEHFVDAMPARQLAGV
jgi:NAD(P) transhydrogenase